MSHKYVENKCYFKNVCNLTIINVSALSKLENVFAYKNGKKKNQTIVVASNLGKFRLSVLKEETRIIYQDKNETKIIYENLQGLLFFKHN